MKVRPLSPELSEKARLELNEDPIRLEKDLQHLKDWIAKQPHLRARKDDQWLLTFLRGCKFSLERTKEKFDLYYTMKTAASELWALKYNDPKFMEILDLGVILPLPKQKSIFPKVIIVRFGLFDPNKYSLQEVMSVSNYLQEIGMYEDDTLMVSGAQAVIDLDGVNTGHLMQMTPTFMKKMAIMGQDASPIRMKGAHYLNIPTGFETIFNFISSLLNEKNRKRLHIHNKKYEDMYQHIPKDILPAEYGGDGGTIQDNISYWKKKVEEYSSWLEEDNGTGTDESKRPGKPKTAESMFGVEGSFRQLQFD